MKSYKQLYQKLPAEALKLLAEQYEPPQLDQVLAGFMRQRPATLRVNRLKTNVRQVMETLRQENVKFNRVLWYEDALVIKNRREKDLVALKLYLEGHIYLQSLSSMLPPLLLHPEPGSKVLDLTAAPGGKTTQLAALMANKGFLVANEINQVRAERLKFNVSRQGASCVTVRVGDGKWLEPQWREYFDAVLLDAPCSGVGLFMLDQPQTYRGWSLRWVHQLVKEQRKLLETALWALRPGGTLVYSTCTLTRAENEANVEWVLQRYPETVRLEPVAFNLTGAKNYQQITTIADSNGRMLTVIPGTLYEGFFVARFVKYHSLFRVKFME
ncbi:MAG: RsmB/NOP family class I SAM-dependent RNA methyltransferase [Bacillota bacterium]|jgi:NOL1/NOP2/sun family putative RNA methylase